MFGVWIKDNVKNGAETTVFLFLWLFYWLAYLFDYLNYGWAAYSKRVFMESRDITYKLCFAALLIFFILKKK